MGIFRGIAAVLIGLLVLLALLAGGFVGLTAGLGMDRLLKPGSYEFAPVFMICAIVLMAVPALAGGYICASIARTRIPVVVLAALMLLWGVAGAAGSMKPDAGPRPAGTTWAEGLGKFRHPAWFALATGAVGAFGVMLGGRLKK